MVIKLLVPKMRFVGWEPMGAFKRAVDERTVDELRESIQLWARRVPEVKQILPELDHMNPKYFGLVADTVELSQKKANSFQDIDMMKEFEFPPFNTLDLLMAHIPIAARKSPSALDFARIAEGFPIKGQPEFSRQEDFMEQIYAILDEGVDVEKIPLLKEVYARIRGGAEKIFDMDKFLQDGTPIEVIKANMGSLERARNYSYSFGKYLDVNAQLSKDPSDVDKVCCLDSIPRYMLEE